MNERSKGIIKYTDKNKKFGYIIPDVLIDGYTKDIVFFESDLQDMKFDELQLNISVEFTLEQSTDKYGKLQYLAKTINFPTSTNKVIIPARPIQTRNQPQIQSEPKPDFKPKLASKFDFSEHFLDKLRDTLEIVDKITDADDFEDCVFYLFRLLGIHTVYQHERGNQAGKADGFFIIENLAVMYDCTLRTPFEEYKQEQIENYINKLSNKAQLTINTRKTDGGRGTKTLQILGKTRQVWIVTRGTTREIQDFDGIKVKEVAIQNLIEIAIKRCKILNYEAEILSSELNLLGL